MMKKLTANKDGILSFIDFIFSIFKSLIYGIEF